VIRVQKPGTSGITLDPMVLDVNSYINNHTDEVNIASTNGYDLKPGSFILGKTVETVGLSNRLSGRVEGRSRLARLGIGVHITAPKIDPGFHNQITLEIFHLGNTDVKISHGMAICTLLLERLGHPAGEGYHGMFQGS
jgi:dCTP deaminase